MKNNFFFAKDRLRPETGFYCYEVNPLADENAIHWHDYVEIEIIVDGSAVHNLNGRMSLLSAGSVYMVRPMDFHSIMQPKGLHILNVSFSDNLLSAELRAFDSTKPALFRTSGQNTAIVETLARLCIMENARSHPNTALLQSLVRSLLIKLEDVRVKEEEDAPRSPIQEAVLYLHDHFRENPSLQTMAGMTHYHSTYFSRSFREKIGISYSEYLNNLKVNHAKLQLISTDKQINLIAAESGFGALSNFQRVFSDTVGMSPREFRGMYGKS